ncbi:MAG: HAMP domain-containing histidine kinase, partial [Acidobacteria bacterium]|nr:HAMP domain-containing histidine kinase [Acidobacteriota bacterium]
MSEASEIERLRQEAGYYKDKLDEVAGENLRQDFTITALRHEVLQKRKGFALLSQLQQSIGAHQQIGSIYEITIAAINSTLGMDKTVVLSPTDRENRYRPTHWIGFQEKISERLASAAIEFPREFASGEVHLVVNKSTPSSAFVDFVRETFGLPYFLAVPIMGETSAIGILLSGRLKEARPLFPPFDQGDLDTFQAIAGFISAHIRNMRVAVLEETDRLKTEFYANISHEFRTPITLSLGPLEQLQAGRYGQLPPEASERIDVVRRNQERLLGLVNQILDLAKLEAGGMNLRASRLPDPNEYVRERVAQFSSAAEERGIDLRLSLDPRASEADLYLDRDRFDRLLFNLLSNALKFTHEGFIEVSSEIHEKSYRLTVTDTGVGIKEDEIPYVFDRFRQADGSEAREHAGTGIGLALVREIALLHGGEVTAYSQYGKG